MRKVGEFTVGLVFQEDGFVEATGFLAYEGPDCTGLKLITARRSAPVVPAHVLGGTAYFQAGPRSKRTLQSNLNFQDEESCPTMGGAFTPPNRCCFSSAFTGSYAAVATFDLSPPEPPFYVDGP